MTIPQIILRAEISQYLAVKSIKKSGLFGGGTPSNLPSLIYQVRKTVSRMYDLDPTESNLLGISNYLYSICGKFGLEASYLESTGGVVPNPNAPTTQYGLPVTDIYTATDGQYILPLNLPSGAKVIYAQKGGGTALPTTSYTYNNPDLTLLGGIVMGDEEVLTYQYVLPI